MEQVEMLFIGGTWNEQCHEVPYPLRQTLFAPIPIDFKVLYFEPPLHELTLNYHTYTLRLMSTNNQLDPYYRHFYAIDTMSNPEAVELLKNFLLEKWIKHVSL